MSRSRRGAAVLARPPNKGVNLLDLASKLFRRDVVRHFDYYGNVIDTENIYCHFDKNRNVLAKVAMRSEQAIDALGALATGSSTSAVSSAFALGQGYSG
jgi:hypothetical protein